MSIHILPNELLEKIFIYLIPGIECNIQKFRQYFFIDKRLTEILVSFSFRCKYAKNKEYIPFSRKNIILLLF